MDSLSWRRTGLEWGALVLLLLAAWYPTASAMATIWWRSDTFAHCLLVPPIAAWLAWRDRSRWLALKPQRWPWALLPLALAALLGLVGELAQVAAASQLALVLALQALTLFVLGPQVGRALAFPLLFLLFAVPVGEFMMPKMMDWTADFTVSALRLVGIPVYREGLQFVIPSGHWSVVEACSGVRYLMASVMVGTLFAYLNFNTLNRRLAFVAFSLVVPLLANWLRAFGIVMLGHVSDNKLATGVDHLVYGWVFFGIVMAAMFMIGSRFAPGQVAAAAAPTGLPVAQRPAGLAVWGVPLLALLLLALPLLAEPLRSRNPAPLAPQLALELPGWQAVPGLDDWQPAVETPKAQWQGGLLGAGAPAPVQAFLAYYPRQQLGSKAVSGENVLVASNDRQWKVLSRSAEGWTLRRLGQEDERWLLQRRHWVHGRLIDSPALAKLAHVGQLLQGGGDAAALVVAMTPADADAPARLQHFWQQAQAPLNECLRAVSSGTQGHNAGRCR